MKTFSASLSRYGRVLLFPLAMIIYDFSAYLTIDLIQPGIISIINELRADVTLAPASVSIYMVGGLALQWLLGPLSDRSGRRPVLLTGALVFALACLSMLFVTSIEQYLVARFIQGTSICFISTVGYVSIQETFGEMDSIRIMAALTSIVLLAPVIGPVAGAALMTFIHWKWLFAILGAFGLVAWYLLLFKMPETIISQGRGFKPGEVLCDFIAAFRHPVVLTGSLAVAFGNLPKGTVSATLNIMALGIIALSIEITRWVYFHAGGRIAFHGAALLAGIAVIILVSRLLKLRRQYQGQPVSSASYQEQ
ncbi:MFS transporter [Citrobacter freundii]|nr:MFS transporter [Citrobacter freundii]